MDSIGQMIVKIGALVGTKDLTEWEDGFVRNIVERSHEGKVTTTLTNKQVEIVERIHKKLFA